MDEQIKRKEKQERKKKKKRKTKMEQTKKEDEKSFILKHKLQYTAESPIYAKRCKILMN